MSGVSPELPSQSWRAWLTRGLAIVAIFLLAACGNEQELWSDASVPDRIPGFRQVSPPDLHALAVVRDGIVVAVGGNGAIMRSTDRGMHWNTVPGSPTERGLQHLVVVAKGALLAVGENGTIIRSGNDGRTWAAVRDTGTDKTLRRVLALSPSVLVAVGDEAAIVRSVDGGDSWSPVYGGDSVTLRDIVATQGRYLVAVGDAGVVVRSDDGGESWTRQETYHTGLHSVLVTRTGALVAVGQGIVRAAGVTAPWSDIKVSITGAQGFDSMPFTHVLETPGATLVALGPGRKAQYSRDDGRTWTPAAIVSEHSWVDHAVVTADGALAAVGLGQAIRSADGGANWTAGTAPKTGSSLNGAVAVPGGILVAVGRAGTILRSDDGGATWAAVAPVGRSERLLGVAAGVNGVLVAVGENGAIMRSADDGQSWAAVWGTGTDERLGRVLAQRTGPWIAVGQLGAILASATGGLTWQRVPAPSGNNELHDILAVGPPGVLVAVGDGGTVLRSENGGWNWALAPRVTDHGLRRVIAHRKVLVAVGDNGTILRSTNTGKTWTAAANSGSDSSFAAIAASGDALVACGPDGNIVRSTDLGNNFVPVDSHADILEHIVAGRDRTLVAIGNHMGTNPGITIVRSSDGGLTWAPVPMHALSHMPLASIVAQPGGVMLGLGGSILRSIDDGASWSEVANTSIRGGQNDGVAARDGRFVAVGEEGVIVRESTRRIAPTIRRVVHSYDLGGNPVLRISLADPDKLCPNGACLSAWARGQLDRDKGKAGDRQAAVGLLDAGGNTDEYELRIDPRLAAASRPEPLYLNFVVDVPGHHRLYQDKAGGDFVVPNNPTPFWKTAWFLALMLLFALLLLLMLVAAFRPLLLLRMMVVQKELSEHEVSGLPGRTLTLLVKVILPILSTQPRVLNAWVDFHAPALAAAFNEAAKKLSDASPYWALPVTGPDGTQLTPSPESLAGFFKPKRAFIEIVGQGGAGKTRLALQVCSWLAAARLTPHPVAVVLVDEEFDDVLAVIEGKVRAALGNEAPSTAFLKVLLTRGRLGVLIDRVSERQQSTRTAVTRMYQSISPKAVICTSRLPVPLDGAPKTSLVPQPLDPDTLLDFVLQQLRAAEARSLFRDPQPLVQFINDMAPHLSGRSGTPRVTPLLVTIVVTQAIESARAHGPDALESLPRNVPEIYFSYVQRLDETRQDPPNVPGISPSALVRLAASIIACAELGEDFRPKRVDDPTVNQALMADKRIAASQIDFIDRFVQNGLLSRRTVGTESTVEYLLDPLAECLAAHVHARACGNAPERWQALLQKVAAQGEGAQGFTAALRMNHEAYAGAFGFPPVAFSPTP